MTTKKNTFDKKRNIQPSVPPPGGKVQPEKHTEIKTDRGTFKFREPKPQNWK